VGKSRLSSQNGRYSDHFKLLKELAHTSCSNIQDLRTQLSCWR